MKQWKGEVELCMMAGHEILFIEESTAKQICGIQGKSEELTKQTDCQGKTNGRYIRVHGMASRNRHWSGN